MRRVWVWTSAMVVAAMGVAAWAQEGAVTTPTPAAAAAGTAGQPAQGAAPEATALPGGLPYIPPPKFDDWNAFVKDWLTPRPIPKDSIVRIDKKYCYPHPSVAFKMEIVKENEDTVWVRGLPPEDPESPIHPLWLKREAQQMEFLERQEWVAEHGSPTYFLDFEAPVVPPPFMDSLTFQPAAPKLPHGGLWQMGFALADMNEDGVPDLVLPPMRKGTPRPWIFLGAKGGDFDLWEGTTWTSAVPYDYGGVVTGDFDGDGHQDLVLAIHFKGQYVLYGDGAGHFGRSARLPSPDPRVTSRAPAIADFDGDGRPDLAFLAELDFDLGTSQRIENTPTLWVVLNRPTGWQLVVEGMPEGIIGDNLEAADVDGDGRPDLVLSSSTNDWRELVYYNRGDKGWEGPYSTGVLSAAYHHDVGLAWKDGKPEIYATFVQFRRIGDKNQAREGIIRYVPAADGTLSAPDGPLLMDDNRSNPLLRLGVGDLDGDGRTDVVAGRRGGGLEVYLQNAAGELVREESPELEGTGRAYDIQVVDLDGDGLDDIVACFADADEKTPGGVSVWLTRPRR